MGPILNFEFQEQTFGIVRFWDYNTFKIARFWDYKTFEIARFWDIYR